MTNSWILAQDRQEVGNLILENIPEIPGELSERLLQYNNTRAANFADWLPDNGGMLITTRFGNTEQFHKIEQPMGVREQMTFFDEPVSGGSFCPAEKYQGFLFSKDRGGNEFRQIYWFDLASSKATMISDGESVNFGTKWSNSGEQFAFTSTRRNQKDFEIYVADMANPKLAKRITDTGGGYWSVADWSPDDSKLILNQYLSVTHSKTYIYDFKKEKLRLISPKTETFTRGSVWNERGDEIYMLTDVGQEFKKLASYHLKSKKTKLITENIDWDIDDVTTNKNRSQIAFTANENGYTQVYLMDTRTNQYKKVPGLPIGQVYSLKYHPTQPLLSLVFNSTQSSGDVYVLNTETLELVRWTKSEVGGLNTDQFPKPELIHYETFDSENGKKRQIPAFVYKPSQAKQALPVIISIHGGPEGQHVPYFNSLIAYWTNELGIAVIAPNVRGSAGYGKTYLKLDNGYDRENSVRDIEKLLDWIEENPELDSERVAVYGGSYGGYMVLSSMFNYNDRIKCGIDIVGISNFVTFLENTEEYRRDLRRVEYGDERDPAMRKFLHKISPTTNVKKIKKPLLVIQGANDPRVPASESEQMVQEIRNNDGMVWYMLAKDEGHGFRKKANRSKMTEAIILFLEAFLLE